MKPNAQGKSPDITSHEAVAGRIIDSASRAGIRRSKLASELSRVAGVTPAAAHRWLSASAAPSKANAEKIASVLGVTPHYLLFGDEGAGAQGDGVAFELMKIQQFYSDGRLTKSDLAIIERFADLLASKNQEFK